MKSIMSVDFGNVRWTVGAVILLIVCVQWASCRAVYADRDGDDSYRHPNRLTDRYHKHVANLKAPDPIVVDIVRRRIKASMKGRRADQSNERNIWTSHPKNENWSGPDTQEVAPVVNSLGF